MVGMITRGIQRYPMKEYPFEIIASRPNCATQKQMTSTMVEQTNLHTVMFFITLETKVSALAVRELVQVIEVVTRARNNAAEYATSSQG